MKYKISELVSINSKAIKKDYDGLIKYIDTSSVNNGKFDNPRTYSTLHDAPSRARRMASVGDTVISTVRPNMKHIGFISENNNYVYSTGFAVVSPNRKLVDPYYLYLYLSSAFVTKTLQSIGETSTSTYPSIKPNDIGNLSVDIPSMKEQKEVANRIRLLDEKIKFNNRINDNLLELLNAQYKHLLSKHNLAKVKLSELCDISAGGDKPKKISKMKSNENLVPVYSNRTNKDGLYGYTNKAKIFKKAVTISARGTIGYTVLRTEPFVPIVRLISLQSKGAISAEFLYLLISNLSIQGYGSTQQQITVPYMKKIVVNIPSLNLINEFQKEISPLFNQIDRNKRENEQLTNIRNVLLDKFF